MDCLNCFAPPRPSGNSLYHRRLRPSHLSTVRDPLIYHARAPRYINRPPTPYPHEEHFPRELLTPRRAYTRTHKRYVNQHTVGNATVVRQRRFEPSPVVVKHISASEDKLGDCDTGTRSLSRRRRSVSFQDQRGVQLQAKIAAQNDTVSSRPALIRKPVAFQEPFRYPELQKRIEAQNNGIRMRPAPVPKPLPSNPDYLYADDLSMTFSDLRLGSRYKR